MLQRLQKLNEAMYDDIMMDPSFGGGSAVLAKVSLPYGDAL